MSQKDTLSNCKEYKPLALIEYMIYLLTPGPVPLSDQQLEILSQPMIHHRSSDFCEIFSECLPMLKSVYQTEQPVLCLTSTGSGALEASVVNLISKGDKLLCLINGKFGERWAEMAEEFGAEVDKLYFNDGKPVDISQLENHLKQKTYSAIQLQACETSVGVLNPVKQIAEIITKASPKTLIMIDAITAIGAEPIKMDNWGLDVVVSGGQKAFCLPTGMSMIALSKKAWQVQEKNKTPKFYFDLKAELKANQKKQTRFSSPVSHIRLLHSVLKCMSGEGLELSQKRSKKLSNATLAFSKEIGLESYSQSVSASLSVLKLPKTIDGVKLKTNLETKHNVYMAGGQNELKGKIIRIGHLGYITNEALLFGLECLAKELKMMGHNITDEIISSAMISAKKSLDG